MADCTEAAAPPLNSSVRVGRPPVQTKVISALVGIVLASVYGYFAWFTTALRGTPLDSIFLSSGVIFFPVGLLFVKLSVSLGFIANPGMGGGILALGLGAYILWFFIFSIACFATIKRVFLRKI